MFLGSFDLCKPFKFQFCSFIIYCCVSCFKECFSDHFSKKGRHEIFEVLHELEFGMLIN